MANFEYLDPDGPTPSVLNIRKANADLRVGLDDDELIQLAELTADELERRGLV